MMLFNKSCVLYVASVTRVLGSCPQASPHPVLPVDQLGWAYTNGVDLWVRCHLFQFYSVVYYSSITFEIRALNLYYIIL